MEFSTLIPVSIPITKCGIWDQNGKLQPLEIIRHLKPGMQSYMTAHDPQVANFRINPSFHPTAVGEIWD